MGPKALLRIIRFTRLAASILILGLLVNCANPAAGDKAGDEPADNDSVENKPPDDGTNPELELWPQILGALGKDTGGTGITVAPGGRVVVSGYTNGSLNDQALSGLGDALLAQYDASGKILWTRLLGASGNSTGGRDVAVDENGGIYIAGDTGGSATSFDGQALKSWVDLIVAKYAHDGTKLWTRVLGAFPTATIRGGAIAADKKGSVYVVGDISGKAAQNEDVDGQVRIGIRDFFITKYDVDGQRLWTRLHGATGTESWAYGVAIAASSEVYVTGFTSGSLDGQTKVGISDLFLVKYDSSGNRLWTRMLGAPGSDFLLEYTRAHGVAVDGAGNVYVTGVTGVDLDGQPRAGIQDLFIVKYTPDGTKLWTRLYGAAAHYTLGNKIIFSQGLGLYVAGHTDGAVGGQAVTGQSDSLLMKVDTEGNSLWTRLEGYSGAFTFGHSVAADTDGSVYTTGRTDTDPHDPSTVDQSLVILKYEADGEE